MSEHDEREDRGHDRERKSRKIDDWIATSTVTKIAETVSKEQVSDIFRDLGYDIADFKELRLLREDLRFLRALREANVERKSTILKSFITAIIGSLLGVIGTVVIYLVTHFPIASTSGKP